MMRDWDDAFANFPYISGSEKLPQIWAGRAAAYRPSLHSCQDDIPYGAGPCQRMDLVQPEDEPKGLLLTPVLRSRKESHRTWRYRWPTKTK